MTAIIQLISHIGVTVVAVVGLALRLEHRLTKIETDVTWLKSRMNPGPKGAKKNVTNTKMD